MTQEEVDNILIKYCDLFKDVNGKSIIYTINGIKRYISGYKLVKGSFILYLAPTNEEIAKGNVLSDSMEWSDFFNQYGNI